MVLQPGQFVLCQVPNPAKKLCPEGHGPYLGLELRELDCVSLGSGLSACKCNHVQPVPVSSSKRTPAQAVKCPLSLCRCAS